jgi:hypothetical protein
MPYQQICSDLEDHLAPKLVHILMMCLEDEAYDEPDESVVTNNRLGMVQAGSTCCFSFF